MRNVEVRGNALTAEIYEVVRATADFPYYDRADVDVALRGGLYSAVAYVDGHVAGIGRVVGDGRIAFFIKDLVVMPQFQKTGIGAMLLEHLLRYVREHCCRHAYVGLMSTSGAEGFYRKHGFIQRPDGALGSGMVLFVDPERSAA